MFHSFFKKQNQSKPKKTHQKTQIKETTKTKQEKKLKEHNMPTRKSKKKTEKN